MTITFTPQTEQRLKTIAERQNLCVEAVVERLVERESIDSTAADHHDALRPRTLVELFAKSPLKGSGVVIERDASAAREFKNHNLRL